MDAISRMLFQPAGGMYRDFHGIKAYLAPRDLSLYRHLLPQTFDMPDSPAVLMFVIDYLKVTVPGMRAYREAAISLRSRYGNRTGWYVLDMPVSSRLALWTGRATGFPKYIEKDISLVREGQAWKGQVVRADRRRLSLEFRAGTPGPLPDSEQQELEAPTFFHGDTFLLVPPGRGPQVMEVRLFYPVAPAGAAVLGEACASVDGNEPWAGLVDWERPAPAAYCHFVGGMSIDTKRLA